jgi:hypothetical protein
MKKNAAIRNISSKPNMTHSLNYWSLLTCLVDEQDEPPTHIGILYSGATSGAITKSNKHTLEPSGKKSHKVFILPDGTKAPATKIHQLHNKLRLSATEMNVVPGITKSLVSICKIADADYITVLDKNGAKLYDDTTTTVTTNFPAILSGVRCNIQVFWASLQSPTKTQATNTPSITSLSSKQWKRQYSGTTQEWDSQQKKHGP